MNNGEKEGVVMRAVSAQDHAKRIAWLQEPHHSIEVRSLVVFDAKSSNYQGRIDFNRVENHYIETSRGWRLLDSRCFMDDKLDYRSVDYCDGKKTHGVVFDRENVDRAVQVVETKGFGRESTGRTVERPAPLCYYWVGLRPLQDALSDARPLGEGEVVGRTCDLFLFSKTGYTGTQDQVYYLDRATSVPLKVVAYRSEADRAADRPLSIWAAKSFDAEGRFPIVKESVRHRVPGDDGQLTLVEQHRVESIELNKDYPASLFAVPKVVPIRVEAADPTVSTPPASVGIRADPPVFWSHYAAPALLGGGLVLVLLGVVLLRRGRRQAASRPT